MRKSVVFEVVLVGSSLLAQAQPAHVAESVPEAVACHFDPVNIRTGIHGKIAKSKSTFFSDLFSGLTKVFTLPVWATLSEERKDKILSRRILEMFDKNEDLKQVYKYLSRSELETEVNRVAKRYTSTHDFIPQEAHPVDSKNRIGIGNDLAVRLVKAVVQKQVRANYPAVTESRLSGYVNELSIDFETCANEAGSSEGLRFCFDAFRSNIESRMGRLFSQLYVFDLLGEPEVPARTCAQRIELAHAAYESFDQCYSLQSQTAVPTKYIESADNDKAQLLPVKICVMDSVLRAMKDVSVKVVSETLHSINDEIGSDVDQLRRQKFGLPSLLDDELIKKITTDLPNCSMATIWKTGNDKGYYEYLRSIASGDESAAKARLKTDFLKCVGDLKYNAGHEALPTAFMGTAAQALDRQKASLKERGIRRTGFDDRKEEILAGTHAVLMKCLSGLQPNPASRSEKDLLNCVQGGVVDLIQEAAALVFKYQEGFDVKKDDAIWAEMKKVSNRCVAASFGETKTLEDFKKPGFNRRLMDECENAFLAQLPPMVAASTLKKAFERKHLDSTSFLEGPIYKTINSHFSEDIVKVKGEKDREASALANYKLDIQEAVIAHMIPVGLKGTLSSHVPEGFPIDNILVAHDRDLRECLAFAKKSGTFSKIKTDSESFGLPRCVADYTADVTYEVGDALFSGLERPYAKKDPKSEALTRKIHSEVMSQLKVCYSKMFPSVKREDLIQTNELSTRIFSCISSVGLELGLRLGSRPDLPSRIDTGSQLSADAEAFFNLVKRFQIASSYDQAQFERERDKLLPKVRALGEAGTANRDTLTDEFFDSSMIHLVSHSIVSDGIKNTMNAIFFPPGKAGASPPEARPLHALPQVRDPSPINHVDHAISPAVPNPSVPNPAKKPASVAPSGHDPGGLFLKGELSKLTRPGFLEPFLNTPKIARLIESATENERKRLELRHDVNDPNKKVDVAQVNNKLKELKESDDQIATNLKVELIRDVGEGGFADHLLRGMAESEFNYKVESYGQFAFWGILRPFGGGHNLNSTSFVNVLKGKEGDDLRQKFRDKFLVPIVIGPAISGDEMNLRVRQMTDEITKAAERLR